MIKQYTRVFITPTTNSNSWEDAINTNVNGPLYGYKEDVQKKGIKGILKELLIDDSFENKISPDDEPLKNYNFINNFYKLFIESKMPDDIEENKNKREELNKDLSNLDSINENTIDVYLKYGIIEIFELLIPNDKLTQEYAILLGENSYIPESNISLYNKSIEDTEKSIDYNPLIKDVNAISSNLAFSAKIYIYSKAKKGLYDITNYIDTISTTVSESGGNFEIKMTFVSEDTLNKSEDKFGNRDIYSSEDISRQNYLKILYFQSLFRENDLVFIKYELLKIEEKETSNKSISGKYWDMIGLIDINSVHSEAFNCSVTITGRDLSKLLIEDTNFFVPYQYANGTLYFGGYSSKLLKRLFSTGKYQLQFLYNLRSIELTIGFILSQLSNIKILTEDCYQWLVNEYGNKLSKEYTIEQEGIVESNKNNSGIFGIIKFSVDEKVRHYRLVDSSISNPQGSLMNQLYKIAQNPFVELIFDTFGDLYYIFARRSPYDKDSILNSNVIIVDPILSISEDLYMDTDIYTVFQYEPRGSLLGGTDNMYLAYLPMIVLDEYVNIWGNKLYKATSNYTNVEQYMMKLKDKDSIKKSPKYTYIKDLLWLIETMSYLPFTRKGKIIIRGDRRIKRGRWIYYQKTNEIFYVDSVTNTASINNMEIERLTVLNVSRGMVLNFLDNKDFNYFNLINLDDLEEGLISGLINPSKNNNNNNKKNNNVEVSIVNKKVFDFFLEGKQFLSKPKEINLSYTLNSSESKIKKLKDLLL